MQLRSIMSLLTAAVQWSGLNGMLAWSRMALFSMRVNSGANVTPALGVNYSIMSTNQRDPEQGSGLGRQFWRGNHPVMRRLQMPAVGDVTPGDHFTEPIGQHDKRELDDNREFTLALSYILDMPLIDVAEKQC